MSIPVPNLMHAIFVRTLALKGFFDCEIVIEPINLGEKALFSLHSHCAACGQKMRWGHILPSVGAYIAFTQRENWEPASLHVRDSICDHHRCPVTPGTDP